MDDARICKTCGKVDYSCMCPTFNGDGESGPRAYTEEEVREKIINQMRASAKYWGSSKVDPSSIQERLDGLVFSILVMFDGGNIDIPAIDMVPSPHPTDKEYCISKGENWYEPGMVINDCQMHELLCALERGVSFKKNKD